MPIKSSPPPPLPPEVRRLVPAEPAPQLIVIDDRPRTRPVGAQSAMVMAGARTVTSVDAMDEAPVDLMARIAPRTKDAQRTASQAAWKARPPVDIEASLAAAEEAGPPALETMFDDVFQELPWHLQEQKAALLSSPRAKRRPSE